MRHGETDWNRVGRIQGWTDVPLNAAGRAQAERLADALAGELVDAVVTSDLSRARETAAIVGARLGLAARIDAGFRERRLGALEGVMAAPGGGDVHAAVARAVSDRDSHPEGAESLAEFRERVRAALDRLRADPAGRDIVVVTHGGVVRAALVALLGDDRRDLLPRIANASVACVEVGAEGASLIAAGGVPGDSGAESADEAVALPPTPPGGAS